MEVSADKGETSSSDNAQWSLWSVVVKMVLVTVVLVVGQLVVFFVVTKIMLDHDRTADGDRDIYEERQAVILYKLKRLTR